ncbi:Stress response NST1-like protein [Quillaja saponaria]|uniref:Stress response NST1-like protein n=1 Tax=Quillaja saponaria TaxID=32244 RepID=A0AAD7M4M0_QUISA|nr:Stress response NST1-like protein [Quillaja saponaria]
MMGKCKGCGKLGRMGPRGGSISVYQFSLLLSPVVSVWECVVRKMRKPKKKQVKDELDRLKQAEKKKRRLEKALATSAAIISELEKKKQKKKEEQQRLDEEGAAIAEAVALHVLLGEDSDDQCNVVVNEGMGGWVSDAYGSGYKWGGLGSGEWSFSSQPMERDFHAPFYEEAGWQELSAGLVAAQAVASLQIEEDAHEDRIVFNRMLREQI